MAQSRFKLTFASHTRLITKIKWRALIPFTIMPAEQRYSELFADAALPKHELLEIHRSKISLHHAKKGYSYPTIRLPHTFSVLAGLPTKIYQTVHEGALAFLVVISPKENASDIPKSLALRWRRSPVRIRPSPSFFCESSTLEPSLPCEKAMCYQFNVNQTDK